MNREPVAIVGAVRLVLLAAITFGLALTDVQLVASMAALEAVLSLIARSRVVPNVTVEEHLETASRLGALGVRLPPADDVPTTGSPKEG